MEALVTNSRKFNGRIALVVIAVFTYLWAGSIVLAGYVDAGTLNIQAGMLTILATISIDYSNKGRKLLLYIAMVLALLAMLAPVKTIFYFLLVVSVAGLVEYFIGRLSVLPLLAAFIMSPALSFAIGTFSFPIRLKLTQVAGWLLAALVPSTKVSGNIIGYKGEEFSVDPACMGLHMLIVGLLAGLVLTIIYQKKTGKQLGIQWLLVLLVLITVFNVAGNMCRIVLLVAAGIMPESIMHDIAGLFCFLLYTLLPAAFVAKKLVQAKGLPVAVANVRLVSFNKKKHWVLPLLIFASVGLSGYKIATRQIKTTSGVVAADHYKTYQMAQLDGNIFKLQNDDALAYIKPIPAFYSGEHHPMFCWGGSGYALTRVTEKEIKGLKFYTAVLQKEKESLYTAWWYDNGSMRTIAQADWRLSMLRGDDGFCLLNITTANEEALEKQVLYFMNTINIRDFILK